MIQAAVITLAGFGLAISAYFAAIGAGLVNPQDRRLPKLCRVEGQDCNELLRSADAKIFGFPNAVVGLLYYGVLLAAALHGDALSDLVGFLVLPGLLSIVLGIYLTARLVIVHRARCVLCLATHAVNLFLFALFLIGL